MDTHRPVIGADVAAETNGGLTAGYDLGTFFDEMFESAGLTRAHYRPLAERLGAMSAEQLEDTGSESSKPESFLPSSSLAHAISDAR